MCRHCDIAIDQRACRGINRRLTKEKELLGRPDLTGVRADGEWGVVGNGGDELALQPWAIPIGNGMHHLNELSAAGDPPSRLPPEPDDPE